MSAGGVCGGGDRCGWGGKSAQTFHLFGIKIKQIGDPARVLTESEEAFHAVPDGVLYDGQLGD